MFPKATMEVASGRSPLVAGMGNTLLHYDLWFWVPPPPLLFILSLEVLMYTTFSCDNAITNTISLDIVVFLIVLPKKCLSIEQPL